MNKKSILDVNVKDKKCLVRVDFNVPLSEEGVITGDNRIVASLPTINYLLDNGAKVILMSHLGRPKGKKNPAFSLSPCAVRLAELIGRPVIMAPDCIGEETDKLVANLKSGEVLLLENLRFYAEEEANDADFCRKLAKYADVYVNDAFGTAHRAHASTAGLSQFCSMSVCGFLMQKELEYLGKALDQPVRPFVAILGGSKVSDKIGVIKNLLTKCDTILIGGGMAYTFLSAMGKKIGKSLCEEDKIDLAKQLIKEAEDRKVNFVLPIDNVTADAFDNDAKVILAEQDIPDGYMGLDIGERTVKIFSQYIANAKTIVWNGPLGVFEMPNFAKGTFAIAKAVAESDAISVIGGGDSASAVKKAGYAKQVTHISTGGGASLEYLEGLVLPGVDCLDNK